MVNRGKILEIFIKRGNLPYRGKAKYNLEELTKMSKVEFEHVINDYFSSHHFTRL